MAEPEMPSETVAVDSYPRVVTNDEITTSTKIRTNEGHKRSRVVVLLIVFLLIILILTTVFILILLFVPRQQILISEVTSRKIGDKQVNEEIYLDSKESLMQYNFKDREGTETWVILDLNRYLEIIKIKKASDGDASVACYVSPITALNPKFSASGNETWNETDAVGTDNWTNRTSVVDFKRSRYAIKDATVLGPKGMTLCKDTDVFWSLPICHEGSGDTNNSTSGDFSGRRRRKRYSWYFRCRWDWNNCYYYSYSDKSYLLYYRCGITCFWIAE